MNCPLELGENAGILLDYAAGKLTAGVRAEIEQHLAACPACHAFAGGQQTVWQALEDWDPAEISLDFDRSLYARIEQDVPWWQRWLRPLNPILRQSVPVAAAAGVLIMAGLMMNRPAGIPVAPAQKTAQVEALQADELQSALADMEMLRQFNQLVPDNAAPKM
jgi:anti-sigma factor RsiW